MKARIRKVLGWPDPDFPRPVLVDGEPILMEGEIALSRAQFGARLGRLILTDRRILWQQTARVMWPFKRASGELRLDQVRSVDKGTVLDLVAGGRRLRFRLSNGRDKCFYDNQGKLDDWIVAIQRALGRLRGA